MVARRGILRLSAAALAGAASVRGSACTLAVPLPDQGAERLRTVFILFRNWWDRDAKAFYDAFDGERLRTVEGAAGRDRWLADGEGARLKNLFENLFSQRGRYPQMQAATLVDDVAFVSVVEHSPNGMGPDCSGLPQAHSFLLTFAEERPASLSYLGTRTTGAVGQVTHWSGGP